MPLYSVKLYNMLAAQPGVDRVGNEFFDMRSDNNILYCVQIEMV